MTENAENPTQPRRGFLSSAAAIVVSLVLGIVPVVSGLLFYLDPLLRRKSDDGDAGSGSPQNKDGDGFIRMPIGADDLVVQMGL